MKIYQIYWNREVKYSDVKCEVPKEIKHKQKLALGKTDVKLEFPIHSMLSALSIIVYRYIAADFLAQSLLVH